jgi:hypothetical protein
VRLSLRSLSLLGSLVATASLGAGMACSDDHDDGDGDACGRILDACHPKDIGVGPVSACHDIAHDGDEHACEHAIDDDDCITICEAAPDPNAQGGSGGGGHGGAGGHGGGQADAG